MAKTEVNGANCNDVYKYLRVNSELYDAAKKQAKEIPWNFAKFIIDSEGKVLKYFGPKDDLEELSLFVAKYVC